MSKKTPMNEEPTQSSSDDDGDDVTEIIPATPATPAPTSDDADVTKIVFGGEKPTGPAKAADQHIPGTVIGVAGARAARNPASAPSSTPSPHTSASGAPGSNEDATTKILFDAAAAEPDVAQDHADRDASGPVSSHSIPMASGDPPETEPTTEPSEIAGPEPQTTQDHTDNEGDTEEKTVFLPPVSAAKKQDDFNPPVGWLVIVDGPGRGAALTIHYGQNTIGRGDTQQIQLNFGDNRIARETHAYVIYDEVARLFYLRDAGQKNLVRVNQKPVLAPVELQSHDEIQIGATTCLFIPLCTQTFDWLGGEDDPATGPGDDGDAS